MKNNFSSNFKFLKLKKGVSQKAIADFFSMSPATVNRWEKGAILPESNNLLKLTEYFGVSLSELVELNLIEGETVSQVEDTEFLALKEKLFKAQEKLVEAQTELVEILKENRELRKELRNKDS